MSEKIGRPRKRRPEIPSIPKALAAAAKLRAKADAIQIDADRVVRDAMRAAQANGHSLADIAFAAGLSRQRVHQITQDS